MAWWGSPAFQAKWRKDVDPRRRCNYYRSMVFQNEKADIIWKYSPPQVNWLERKGFFEKLGILKLPTFVIVSKICWKFAYISFELEIRSSLYDDYDNVISILLYIFASDKVSDKMSYKWRTKGVHLYALWWTRLKLWKNLRVHQPPTGSNQKYAKSNTKAPGTALKMIDMLVEFGEFPSPAKQSGRL